jgi:hypothetical protein
MQGNSVTIGGRTNNFFFIDWSLSSQNAGANQSNISYAVYFYYDQADAQLDDGDASLGGVLRWDVPGRVRNYGATFTARSVLLNSGSFTVTHDNAGNFTLNVNGSIGGSLSARSGGSANWALPQINRTALPPTINSSSRDAAGTTATIISNVAAINNNGPAASDYNYQWSTNNSSWSADTAMGVDRTATLSVGKTTAYWFRARAINSAGGWSAYGASAGPFYGFATAPQSVVATPSSSISGRINLSWTAPSNTSGGITGYKVYRKLSSGSTYSLVATLTGTGTTYADEGLARGSLYDYYVTARNAVSDAASGESDASTAVTSVRAPGSPTAPTLETAVASTDTFGKVTLTWTKPTNTAGGIIDYYLYADGVVVASVTGEDTLTGDITGLNLRQTYSFTVRARNQYAIDNGTTGDASNAISRKSPGPPTAPTGLVSEAPFFPPGTVDLDWVAPTDVGTEGGTITGYSIYLAGGTVPIKTTTGTGTSTTIEDLIPATTYTFNVRARNEIADIVGTFSNASNSTTATAQGEPDAPTGLTVVPDPLVAGRLILTWTPPVGYNTGFRVYTGAGALIANIAAPRLEIDGLAVNTSFSYKVRARNPLTDQTNSEGGPFSATVSGTTGGSSSQLVPNIAVSNSTNNTFVGTYTLIGTTATTMSYNKTASNISLASVPTSGGTTVNNTNTNLNGTYTIGVTGTQATSTAITYTKAGSDISLNTSTPSGTMTNNTNAIFNGSYEVLASPAPDPITKTVSYSKVSSDISSRVASGAITNNSNAVYNGEYVITEATETTIVYDRVNEDIEESDAFGVVTNKTNQDIFNGNFTLLDVPDHKTVQYSTGDLTYGENLITNPSMETVQSGTTVLRTNLISNPSFDTNITGWSGTNASVARSSDVSKFGTHSALVSPSSNTGSVSNGVTISSSGDYTLSAWVYAPEAKNIQVISGSTFAVPADTWTKISSTITLSSGSTSIGFASVDSTIPFYIDGVLLEAGTTLKPYFDGASADELGWNYEWTGTANASTSTAKALTTAVRTNLIPNPSFETNLTGVNIGGFDTSATRTTSQAYSGTYSIQLTSGSMGGGISYGKVFTDPSNLILAPNTNYVASAWVKGTSGQQVSISIAQFNSTENLIDINVAYLTLSSSNWERIFVTDTTQASISYATVGVGPTSSSSTIFIDAVQLELGTTPSTYFDGSIAGAAWTGTAHASTSTTGGTSAIPVGLSTASSEITSSYGPTRSGVLSALVTPSANTGGATLTMTTVASTVYTFSAWVYSSSAKNIQISADSTVGSVIAIPATTWTRAVLSFTASDTSTLISILGTDSTTAFYLDDIMLQESPTVQAYFDGDTDDITDTWPVIYTWAGTPNASISIREVGGTLPEVGAEILSPYGNATRLQSDAQLQIRYRSGWLG